jgi:hypothetical protein
VVTRRAALAAGLVALAGCGGGAEDEAPAPPDHVTLDDLRAREQALALAAEAAREQKIAVRHAEHATRLEAAVRRAGGTLSAAAARQPADLAEGEREAMRAYVEALPLLSSPEPRVLAADLLAENAQHLAVLIDQLPDAFGGMAA